MLENAGRIADHQTKRRLTEELFLARPVDTIFSRLDADSRVAIAPHRRAGADHPTSSARS
jgi:hypothetical protein